MRDGASGARGTPRAARPPSPRAPARRSRRAVAVARPPSAAPVCSLRTVHIGGYNQPEPFGVVRPLTNPAEVAPPGQAEVAPGQTYRPRSLTRRVRPSIRAGVRALPRLLPDPVGIRA